MSMIRSQSSVGSLGIDMLDFAVHEKFGKS